jgi:hypothetical protein
MAPKEGSLIQGNLDVLILRALSEGSSHGYGIAQWGACRGRRRAGHRGLRALHRITPARRARLARGLLGCLREQPARSRESGTAGVVEKYSIVGLLAARCRSISSTVPLTAPPVGVPILVQKIPTTRSASPSWRLITA